MTRAYATRGSSSTPLVRRFAATLRDLDSLDAVSIRARVIEAVRHVARARYGGFYTIRPLDDGRLKAAAFQGTDSIAAARLRATFQHVVWPLPQFDPRRPPASGLRFDPLLDGDPNFLRAFEGSGFMERVLSPIDTIDQMRTYIYHGDEFIGWVGVIAAKTDATFSRADARRADELIAPITAALVAAERAERRLLGPAGADFVVCPRGKVEFASDTGRAWLAVPGYAEALCAAIRAIDTDGSPPPSLLLREGHARWTRLHGDAEHRYLVHVACYPPAERAPDAALTGAQRRVAECLAAGATIAQAAHALGIHAETVRSHVKRIYARLGIASRAELARRLGTHSRLDPTV